MKGVLLVNLGSPEAPTPEAVKPYLEEFLMDKRVIDFPYLLRYLLVKGIILNVRPKKTAKAYKKIWWKEGSPLLVISERTAEKIREKIDIPLSLAMRYGKPSIAQGLEDLHKQGVKEVLILPLYPQYAMATTETIFAKAEEIRKKKYPDMVFSKIDSFYNEPEYIKELSDTIRENLEGYDYDHLIFSYHGVPERHLKKTDKTQSHKKIIDHQYCCTPGTPPAEYCYRTHCFETTRQVVEYLQLPKEKYSQTFQSRLGLDKWLEPFTDATVEALAKKGVKKIAVVTPAFVADCIETLEEIEMAAGKSFKENGGEEFRMIPCLNDRDSWTAVLSKWITNWATT